MGTCCDGWSGNNMLWLIALLMMGSNGCNGSENNNQWLWAILLLLGASNGNSLGACEVK